MTADLSRGQLRIFLGASPGVGKTFAMLEEGHRLRDDGIDVVIGYVEDHGRVETRELTIGLELVPRQRLEYRDVSLEEMDVEAIARRHPDVVLVDELAHSNAPGVGRLKRWQDVNYLLDLGIDVITTVNIQHIEELADVVEGITGVTVRETVPDRLIDQAEEIYLVDLPADALIERLEDGKIYPSQQAAKALDHFFTVGNLTALRELALRRTADGVHDRLSDLMLGGLAEVPETNDCIAVLMDDGARWGVVLRKAWRLASAFHCELVVMYWNTSDATDPKRAQSIRLAEDLGAEVIAIDAIGATNEERLQSLVVELRRVHTTYFVMGVNSDTRRALFRRSDKSNDRDVWQYIEKYVSRIGIVLVPMGHQNGQV